MEKEKDIIQKDNTENTLEMGYISSEIKSDRKEKSVDYYEKNFSEPISFNLSKRTNKIISALYLVTDCIEENEPIRNKLRELGVSLITNVRLLSSGGKRGLDSLFKDISLNVLEIISFLEIAENVGFVSSMNFNILKNEFVVVLDILESKTTNIKKEEFLQFVSGATVQSYRISDDIGHDDYDNFNKMSDTEKDTFADNKLSNSEPSHIGHKKEDVGQELVSISREKDTSIKRQDTNFIKKEAPRTNIKNQNNLKKELKETKKPVVLKKNERSNLILKLIKQKKEVAIKDIAKEIPDCSEKTIQRELINMVEAGTLKKTGEKRWSRYSLV